MSSIRDSNIINHSHLQLDTRKLIPGFWLITALIILYEVFWSYFQSIFSFVAAILITVSALLPSYLWCSGRAIGIPIYPLFALTFVWTYAFPLISKHPIVQKYTPASHFEASLICAFSLFIGTLTWLKFSRRPSNSNPSYRVLSLQSSNQFFLACLIAGCILNIGIASGEILLLLGGLFSTIQAAILALVGLSVFVLAYKSGEGNLRRETSIIFHLFLILYMLSSAVSLLLVRAASIFLIATVAYIIGSKRLPLRAILIFGLCFTLLHFGKAEMREKYWFSGLSVSLQPWDYPAWYSEWAGYSFNYLKSFDSSSSSNLIFTEKKNKQSLFSRSSLVHLFLLVQDRSPNSVPYLEGKTYTIIPELLIPRYLNPEKIASHEGTYLLNIHYGLQRRQDTLRTTIGWGLFAEAYANYGILGCFIVTSVLGAFYGKLSSWAYGSPLLSSRSLLSILVITLAFQTEFSAGVYVAALFQGTMVLLVVFIFMMKNYTFSVSLPNSHQKQSLTMYD